MQLGTGAESDPPPMPALGAMLPTPSQALLAGLASACLGVALVWLARR